MLGDGDQYVKQMEQPFARETDRYTVNMSVGDGDRKSGAMGRCLTNKIRYERRLSNDDSKEVYNKHHFSLADELNQLSVESFTPVDWTADPPKKTSGTACERDEAMENIDLASPEMQKASTAAGLANAGTAYKPKNPSKLALQLGPTDHSENETNSISSKESSRSRNQTSPSPFPDPTEDPNTEPIEKNQPSRSPLEIWLDGIQDAGIPLSEEIHNDDFESDIALHNTHRTSPPTIPIIDENAKSSSAAIDEMQHTSPTHMEHNSSRQTSQSTTITLNQDACDPKPKPASFNDDDDEWSSDVDFDAEIHLQTLTPCRPQLHAHSDADKAGDGDGDGDGGIATNPPPSPLPEIPSGTQSAGAVAGKTLDEFVKVSVFAVDAIRKNGGDKMGDKIREIQDLVERVLVGEVCGRRVSVGDRLDADVWRVYCR